ncbi:hypothetical protein GCM10027598_80790 [Amycolatopsis oliviviridis]|uniref:Uncharacterized protein n=1 Tax=Amycolatopsis oliviviridis TaxID=1471590 RepID=A0ABQ3L642_9PSEU|nr:hypothetical protein GCM10017790_10690 [Amycolatopsis oliviviridis]
MVWTAPGAGAAPAWGAVISANTVIAVTAHNEARERDERDVTPDPSLGGDADVPFVPIQSLWTSAPIRYGHPGERYPPAENRPQWNERDS